MSVQYQFTATIAGNTGHSWFVWGFPHNRFVNWSIRPSAGQTGKITLFNVSTVTASDGTITYWLNVYNVIMNQGAVTFDVFYQWEDF
jgi:hypothetical protein